MRRSRRVRTLTLGALVWVLAAGGVGTSPAASQPFPTAGQPVPVMAYYYIWFDVRSWDRAKTDYPLLGRYSSDDTEVMRQHVRWAKQAGVAGFIVSWKSTYLLDPRLEKLMEVAASEGFYLWIIYQGLDFQRDPQPVERIVDDLGHFLDRYADHPAFAMYDRPVVIWSGTWKYGPRQIAAVARAVGDRLYLLASERNVRGYQRLAELVDGNAYYWSSANPSTHPGYAERLAAMGRAVQEKGGLWVAPAAPGFDARLVGGSRVVGRHRGKTLRRQLDAAQGSSPDAIGVISWNEFSENTHVEPSKKYGAEALNVLADWVGAAPPQIAQLESDLPGTTVRGSRYPLYLIGGFLSLVLISLISLSLRRQ